MHDRAGVVREHVVPGGVEAAADRVHRGDLLDRLAVSASISSPTTAPWEFNAISVPTSSLSITLVRMQGTLRSRSTSRTRSLGAVRAIDTRHRSGECTHPGQGEPR